MKNNNLEAFFSLIRAGLWETSVQLLPYEKVDYSEVMRLAEEQSVVGLITAGLEYVKDVKVPQSELLLFVGQSLQLEQENIGMNTFIAVIVDKMRQSGINAILVKGQGVAQCYNKPLWRSPGDVDFLLDEENYYKAIDFLKPLSSRTELQDERNKAYGFTADSYIIELHGTLHCGLSRAMDKEIDLIQANTFTNNRVRSWNSEGVEIYIPAPDNDVLFVFTHIIKHLYKGGIGLRQICDWSQLIWKFHKEIDCELLYGRIKRMALIDEWRALAAFAVDYLGHPADAMPLYDVNRKWSRKASHIYKFVMDVGNFGHNRDLSYYWKYNLIISKTISFGWRLRDITAHAVAFPKSALRFFPRMLADGMQATAISALKNKNE